MFITETKLKILPNVNISYIDHFHPMRAANNDYTRGSMPNVRQNIRWWNTACNHCLPAAQLELVNYRYIHNSPFNYRIYSKWPFSTDAGHKQWLCSVFNTENEAKKKKLYITRSMDIRYKIIWFPNCNVQKYWLL